MYKFIDIINLTLEVIKLIVIQDLVLVLSL